MTDDELLDRITQGPICKCGAHLETRDDGGVYPFCCKCGNRNPYWYPKGTSIPERHLDAEMLEEMKDCEQGHSNRVAEIATWEVEDRKLAAEYPFCEFCGHRIVAESP